MPIARRRGCCAAGWWSASSSRPIRPDGSTLELVYFLGAAQDGDGTGAAVRINAATREAAMLAEVWGDDLQRVVWDAVLDAIQVALQRARREHPNEPLTLRGFLATPEGLQVNVVTGAL